MIKGISRGLRSLALAGLLATAPLGASNVAAQDGFTTGQLLQDCTAEDTFRQLAGLRLIMGYDDGFWMVIDVAGLLDVDLNHAQWGYCAPDNVTFGQMRSIFVKWAQDNPALWHEAYGVGFVRSQREVFPCQ